METNVAQLPLSHKAFAWFEKNRKQALIGVAAVLFLAVVAWLFVTQSEQKQLQASYALSNALAAQMAASDTAPPTPQAYLKVAAEYPKSEAAPRALLLAAGALFMEGKYSEAQAQFERYVREYRESPFLGQALIGIASCLEAQGKTDQAVTAYKELIARHPLDSVITQARFSLGGLYEVQKRPELARDMYEQVERDARMSILGSEAGMRLEELAEKNPNLAPSAASTPPTMPIAMPVTPAGTNTSAGTNPPAVIVLPAKK